MSRDRTALGITTILALAVIGAACPAPRSGLVGPAEPTAPVLVVVEPAAPDASVPQVDPPDADLPDVSVPDASLPDASPPDARRDEPASLPEPATPDAMTEVAAPDGPSVIEDVSYVVEPNEYGQLICPNASSPAGCRRQKLRVQKCAGQAGRCTIKVAWSDAFGGEGELGPDPCPFIVKNVLDIQYTCSHDGVIRSAQPAAFRPEARAGCDAGLLGTAVLRCP